MSPDFAEKPVLASMAYKRMALPGGAMFVFEDNPDGDGAEIVTIENVCYVKIGSRHYARIDWLYLEPGAKIYVTVSGMDNIDMAKGRLFVLNSGSAGTTPEDAAKDTEGNAGENTEGAPACRT